MSDGPRHQGLLQLLAASAEQAREQPQSLGTVLQQLEASSFALVTLVLCLPYLQPLPLGPLAGLGGSVLAALGWQLLCGHEQPWLPERIHRLQPGPRTWARLGGVCNWVLRISGWLTRERLSGWIDGATGRRWAGSLILAGGILLALPMPVAPFTNALPALGMLCAAMALLERDGLMLLLSVLALVATLLYFAFVIAAYLHVGQGAWAWLTS